MSATTGRALEGIDHLRQSLRDILTTPLGSRVKRRDYGSRLYELVDAPGNQETMLQIYAATAEAIRRWEPRFKLTRVVSSGYGTGRVELTVYGTYLPDGQAIVVDGLVVT